MTLHPDDLERARAIREPLRPKVMAVVSAWCDETGFTLKQLQGPGKGPRLIAARHGLMWVLRRRLGMSYTEIGLALRRHHTTVMHGVEKEDLEREDAKRETPPG